MNGPITDRWLSRSEISVYQKFENAFLETYTRQLLGHGTPSNFFRSKLKFSALSQDDCAGGGLRRHFGTQDGVREVIQVVLRAAKIWISIPKGQIRVNLPLLPLPSSVNKIYRSADTDPQNSSFVIPLYLEAIFLLIPPAAKKASVEDPRGDAQLMTDLSELVMRGTQTPQTLHQSEAWASQAIAVKMKARGEAYKSLDVCEEIHAAALYDVTTFRDMAGNKKSVRDLFRNWLDQARSIAMTEGIVESSKAWHWIDLGRK
ncbi:hypothetical protein GYMLUDRAFT_244565 [Collybiopsis luxurians FD-317 M1]|uniref:Uncharacterized protein n=1 Tax=Collybiopsis luxurians FD-317 M1 TaxID=944289 RepID=A0A0D0B964_9AGAR|nr:hypothetical protein GYMLUDRAFT_244565 [Collybiopsis luxurians FD-317 M1]